MKKMTKLMGAMLCAAVLAIAGFMCGRRAPGLVRGNHKEGLRAQNISVPQGTHHVEKRPHGDEFRPAVVIAVVAGCA